MMFKPPVNGKVEETLFQVLFRPLYGLAKYLRTAALFCSVGKNPRGEILRRLRRSVEAVVDGLS